MGVPKWTVEHPLSVFALIVLAVCHALGTLLADPWRRLLWLVASQVKAGDLRRPVSCEPPLMGIPGIRDPPAARERRYARITSKRQLDVGMGEEGEEEADPFASRQNRSTGDLGAAAQLEQTWLQEVVEARLAYKDDRLDGLVIQELEAVDKESDLLAAATMAVYQAYLPSRGRAAHRGRELKGWTSPRAWEPPCGRYEPGEGPSARQCDEERRAAAEAEAGTWLRQPPLQTWDTGMQEDYNGLRPFGCASLTPNPSLPITTPPLAPWRTKSCLLAGSHSGARYRATGVGCCHHMGADAPIATTRSTTLKSGLHAIYEHSL